MVPTDPDPVETARRLRAAVAYVGLSDAEAAKIFGVSVPTFARMKARKGRDRIRRTTWGELWRFADAVGLPRAWFTADFSQLDAIVPPDMPRFMP